MKYKSKRAKATDIPKEIKEKVYIRDGGKCIVCLQQGLPNAHYIPRSRGGLGIEQNIVTLCPRCHHNYDNGGQRKEIGNIIRSYLKMQYGETWCEEELIYRKGNKKWNLKYL